MNNLILLGFYWVIWCGVHSFLITRWVNKRVHRHTGFLSAAYRLFYVFFSFVSLVPVLLYQYSLPQVVYFEWAGPWRILQVFLLCYAGVMFYAGKQAYDINYFLGIRQWRDYRQGRQQERAAEFKSQGILRYVRHPWYSGSLALIWALGPFSDVTLTVRIILCIYLVVGTLLEEQKLKKEIGRLYVQYCEQVPMLIPWRGRVEWAGSRK